MKPIRSELSKKIFHNTWDDSEIPSTEVEQHHYLKQPRGLEIHQVEHVPSLQCGHLAEPAGLCSECSGAICASCYVNCSCCPKPLGPCHAKKDKHGIWFCRRCYRTKKRLRFWQGFWWILLSPFIRFDTDDNSNSQLEDTSND